MSCTLLAARTAPWRPSSRPPAEGNRAAVANQRTRLLTAIARLISGEAETHAQFEAEPTAFRWIFYRAGNDVWIRLLQLSDGAAHDNAGTEIWSTQQSVGTVARAVIRCFDEVAKKYGESGYRGRWGEHFPRTELEALRSLWRTHRSDPAA
ncbi:hypothetical protein AB0940_31670 [Streptomyces sp. NPDC006656]|uniref:hypothetical protein n=1 Tax=Streptomyces sp. NPDC006656 TaxID=3156899 RepID=UPI0034517561